VLFRRKSPIKIVLFLIHKLMTVFFLLHLLRMMARQPSVIVVRQAVVRKERALVTFFGSLQVESIIL
jgi:hypothetical protein